MGSITDSIHEQYTTNVTFSKLPVGDIHIMDGYVSYVYNPKEDITVHELALLIRLFAMAAVASNSYNHYDYWAFVEEKNLTRHFDKK